MATLDAAGDALVVRIVYDGPPIAGKTTSLLALAERLGHGRLFTPEVSGGGRTLFFDWLEYVGGRYDGRAIHCEIVSVPGQAEFAPRRRLLLSSADAVVFVGDTCASGIDETTAHLADLRAHLATREGPPVGVVLQANKRDLPDAVPLERLRGHGLAVIESVASRGEGIREAFVFGVRLALDRVRELERLGLLHRVPRAHDEAGRLLTALRGVALSGDGRVLFPEAASQTGALVGHAPKVPDAEIPSGWVWPPINGRVSLQEATARGVPLARELSPDEWVADSESGWRFHSPPGGAFVDPDEARAALILWAQVHASLADWMSPSRCVALVEHGGRFRLWQVVRSEPTVWKWLASNLKAADAGALVDQAARLCNRVAESWAKAPWELPCTLETVSALDGSFVSLVPDAGSVRPTESTDRRARLRHQLQTLLEGELGVKGHALARSLAGG